MSQFRTGTSNTTTSMRMAAIRIKSANKQIFRALLSLASATLLSRMMGMVNQVLVSSRFGAGTTMDAYFIASTLPMTMAYLIINTAEAAVIPVYTRVRLEGEKKQVYLLFSTLLNLLIVGTVVLTLLMLIFRYQMIFFAAPALDPTRTALASSLTPLIYPVLTLMVIIGFVECILNTEGQFGWPAYAGLLVPLATAIFVLFAGKSYGVIVLCIGTLVGLCFQLSAMIIRVKRAGLVYRPVLNLRNPDIALILAAAGPAFIGGLISQASPLVDQMFASSLSAGSISALSYALKLISVISSVIFVSSGRAVLPQLSRQASANDIKGFKETLRMYLWCIGTGTIILSIFMIIFAHPIVQLLFQRGAFSVNDTDRTALTLVGFLIGLTPMSFSFIAFRVFSALGQTKVLVRVSIFSVITNAVFDYIFAHFWQSFGIALSTSVVYLCTMVIQLIILQGIIGKLDLFIPPTVLLNIGQKIRANQYQPTWMILIEEKLQGISYNLRQKITRVSIIILAFAIGIVGVFQDSINTLRISMASIVFIFLVRYRYALLILWVLIDGPNAAPIFRGTNVLIGLTVPTLFLMTSLPIKQTFQRMPALNFLLIYLLWVFAGITISPLGVGPFLTLWTELFDCLAVTILVINVLTTRESLLKLIDASLLIALVIAMYGMYGYFTKQNGAVDPTTSLFRTFSVFSAAPALAEFFSIIIPLALYRLFTLQGFKRIIVSILVFIFLITTGMTFTRSAFISIPLSIVIMIFCLPSRKMKFVLLSCIVALIVLTIILSVAANIPILGRFFGQDVATFNGRTFLWQAIMSRFDPTQLRGNGLRAADVLLANLQIGINGQGLIATSPSNLFLGTLYDHGIIGVILLTLLLIALFTILIGGLRKTTGDQHTLFAVAIAILVSMLIQSFDSNDFWNQAISIYIWITVALPFALCWSPLIQPSSNNTEIFDQLTEPQMKAIQLAVQKPIVYDRF